MFMNIDVSTAVTYHYDQFPPRHLDYGYFVQQLVKATDAIARYDQMLKNMHNNEILLAPLRNQEAVISSRMEGTISTMDEIFQYEADAQGDDSQAPYYRQDVFETILYQRALKNAQKGMESGYELSNSFIKMMHQQLLFWGRGASKSPGEFKTEQNYLGDKLNKRITFVPISPEKLTDGIDLLLRYIQEDSSPALVKAAIAHLEFEALHPFQDGNGRIGRMLITLLLWSSGIISAPHFYISGYFEDHKEEYIATMRSVSATGNWNEWCVFFLNAVESQAIRNLKVAESIRELYQEMKGTFSEILSSKWTVNALDYIFTNPVFRNNTFTSGSGIPPATASRFTKNLLSRGLLVTKAPASGRRSALYSFEPLMSLVRV